MTREWGGRENVEQVQEGIWASGRRKRAEGDKEQKGVTKKQNGKGAENEKKTKETRPSRSEC
jgi:hypothetical protein